MAFDSGNFTSRTWAEIGALKTHLRDVERDVDLVNDAMGRSDKDYLEALQRLYMSTMTLRNAATGVHGSVVWNYEERRDRGIN